MRGRGAASSGATFGIGRGVRERRYSGNHCIGRWDSHCAGGGGGVVGQLWVGGGDRMSGAGGIGIAIFNPSRARLGSTENSADASVGDDGDPRGHRGLGIELVQAIESWAETGDCGEAMQA